MRATRLDAAPATRSVVEPRIEVIRADCGDGDDLRGSHAGNRSEL